MRCSKNKSLVTTKARVDFHVLSDIAAAKQPKGNAYKYYRLKRDLPVTMR